jgi:hypothetical protein
MRERRFFGSADVIVGNVFERGRFGDSEMQNELTFAFKWSF